MSRPSAARTATTTCTSTTSTRPGRSACFFVPVMPYGTDEYLVCPVCRHGLQIPLGAPVGGPRDARDHGGVPRRHDHGTRVPRPDRRVLASWARSRTVGACRGQRAAGRRVVRPLGGSAPRRPAGRPGSSPRRRYPDRRRIRRGKTPAIGAMNVARKHGKKAPKARTGPRRRRRRISDGGTTSSDADDDQGLRA